MRRTLGQLPAFWLNDQWPARVLAPLGCLYGWFMQKRREYYLSGRFSVVSLDVPVVVVGNIFVGGTGKTPLVVWLVEAARERGFNPGVILRGYGGQAKKPRLVTAQSDPLDVGDEAVLIAQRIACPVAIGRNRVAAARCLTEHATVDLIISDDGLQHYKLGRDVEIAVIDGARGLGNRRCLPAGPLRECPARLTSVQLVVANGPAVPESHGQFVLAPGILRPLRPEGSNTPPVPGDAVHAVAGIGHPDRFFDMLRSLNYKVIPHAFADHQVYQAADLAFDDALPIFMTEKDAVKCQPFAPSDSWVLPVTAQPDAATKAKLINLLAALKERE